MIENSISLIISKIVAERGASILNTPSIFCAILDDMATQLPQERKIFRRALTEKSASLLFLAIESDEKERDTALAKLELYFTDELGLSRDWSNQIITIFSDAFDWNYSVKTLSVGNAKEKTNVYTSFDVNKLRNVIAACTFHTLAIRENGTVIATGDNRAGQCNVSDWKDIIAVTGDAFHSVGLKSDGTVVATTITEPNKKFDAGQCNVSSWKDIIDIAVGHAHTVGLKADGTVVAAGSNRAGQCNVNDWKDIIAISARGALTLGLKADGTVIATGLNNQQQCMVGSWKNIKAIASGAVNSIGLTKEGNLLTTKYIGDRYHGQCDISDFDDIVMVSANSYNTVGLRSDGTVISTKYIGESKLNYGQCDIEGWSDIVAVSAAGTLTVGLKRDGSLVAMGDNYYGQCNVSGWKLFHDIDNYICAIDERKQHLQKQILEVKNIKQEKVNNLSKEQANLKEELSALKGLFVGRRRKEIEERLLQIEQEIKKYSLLYK